MNRDPYKNQKRYISWKKKVEEKGISEVSITDDSCLVEYLNNRDYLV